ncbi:MAG: hypothetical protein HY286_02260 [Planctomycetes bacterium]|nr:hypothetical protein [Planctomycetota bacterium]
MLTIWYHRDFDGIASAAILADVLRQKHGRTDLRWQGINHDRRSEWIDWGKDGAEFACVDFFFHPRAMFWFDHHPTTFINDDFRQQYQQNERWRFDPTAPSCPPIILKHAAELWDYKVPERFRDLEHWSNVIDSAKFKSAEEALFGDQPALRIMRALTVAPRPDWSDEIVRRFLDGSLESVANDPDLEKRYQRACRNRDSAIDQFESTIVERHDRVLLYDAVSDKIRRERFAAFYLYSGLYYAVGIVPTRGGLHITAATNPWNVPPDGRNVGEICERYGGGGHKAVGGANPESYAEAVRIAREIAHELRDSLSPRK